MVKRTYEKDVLISQILQDDYIECGIDNDFSDVDSYCLDKVVKGLDADCIDKKEQIKKIRSKFFDYELNLYIEKLLRAVKLYDLINKENIRECKVYYLNDDKKTLKYPFINDNNYLNDSDEESYLMPYNSMYNLVENIYKVWILTNENQYIIKNPKYSRVINEQLKEVIVNII